MELTDEQVERAAEELWLITLKQRGSSATTYKWAEVTSHFKEEWRERARAAAPFLQMPWEWPTPEEAANSHTWILNGSGSMESVLRHFVTTRNAALTPKPVDPRREKLIAAMRIATAGPSSWEDRADRVLAALDAV